MIRPMTKVDFDAFWPTFEQVIVAQQTYAFSPQMDREQSHHIWCELPKQSFVYEQNGEILGSYYIKANAQGPGGHVCNCGYMVSEAARGQGIARAMCEHSLQMAREMGFKAMQFNSVVATNQVAVALWQKLGFEIVGTLPNAYQHAKLGLVDCYVMYQWLGDE